MMLRQVEKKKFRYPKGIIEFIKIINSFDATEN
jgi:hypothetical protein